MIDWFIHACIGFYGNRRNKDKSLELAKYRNKRNFFRIRATLRKDECEDLNDDEGIAYDWYQYWDETLHRWMWYSGERGALCACLTLHPFT